MLATCVQLNAQNMRMLIAKNASMPASVVQLPAARWVKPRINHLERAGGAGCICKASPLFVALFGGLNVSDDDCGTGLLSFKFHFVSNFYGVK